jgi:mannosyltransferase
MTQRHTSKVAKNRNISQPVARKVADQPATSALFHSKLSDGGQTLLICLVLFLVALGFNLYRIGDPSIWFDEALSVTRARQPMVVLLRIISVTQPNMALYYVLLHFWLNLLDLFGLSATEGLVRFPSALFSAIDTLLIYFLAQRFFARLTALFVSVLYLLNTLQLTYAQEARAYTLQLLFLSLSWYALCVLFSSELSRKRACLWWSCLILSSVCAVYTQLFSELVLATQAMTIILLCLVPNAWKKLVRRQMHSLLLSWMITGLFLLPILYVSQVGSKTAWLPVPRLNDLKNLFLVLANQNRLLLALFLPLLALGPLVIASTLFPHGQKWLSACKLWPGDACLARQWQQRAFQLFPFVLLLVCWLVGPIMISYFVSKKALHLFSPRYLVVVVPAFLLLVASGISSLRWRAIQVGLGLCMVVLSLFSVTSYYQSAQVEDWRTGTQWLQQRYHMGDGLLCYDNSQGCAIDIEYYLQVYPYGVASFDADSPGYFPWVTYDTTNLLGNYKQALDVAAIQAYGATHPRLFFGLGRVDNNDPLVPPTLHWLNTHYYLLAQKKTSSLTLYLYETTIYAPQQVATVTLQRVFLMVAPP